MGKLSISRVFETSRLLAKKTGQEMSELITFTADLAEQILRTMRNGITFADNIDCKITSYTFSNNVEQTIDVGGRIPIGVFAIRTVSKLYGVTSIAWYIDDNGAVKATLGFTNSPTSPVQTTLVILFG